MGKHGEEATEGEQDRYQGRSGRGDAARAAWIVAGGVDAAVMVCTAGKGGA